MMITLIWLRAQSAGLRARRGADNFLRLARPFCGLADQTDHPTPE